MTLIAGASQYINQAAVSNKLGLAGLSTNVLAETSAGAASLLDVGRQNSVGGIGLSNSARFLNRQLIEQNSAAFNGLFSLTGGGSATIDSALVQINALRSSTNLTRDVEAPKLPSSEAQKGSVVDQEV